MSMISFFGYEVLPDKTGQHEPPEGCVLHVSQASLSKRIEDDEEILVYVAVHSLYKEDMEDEPKKYCICRLNNHFNSVPLNIKFGNSDMVFFSIEREERTAATDSGSAKPSPTKPEVKEGEKKEGDKEDEESESSEEVEEYQEPSSSVHLTGYYEVVEDDIMFDDEDSDVDAEMLQEIFETEDKDLVIPQEELSKLTPKELRRYLGDSAGESDDEELPPPPPPAAKEVPKEEKKEEEKKALREKQPKDWKKLDEELKKEELGEESDDEDFAPNPNDEFSDSDDGEFGADFSLLNKEDMMALVTGSPKMVEVLEEEPPEKPELSDPKKPEEVAPAVPEKKPENMVAAPPSAPQPVLEKKEEVKKKQEKPKEVVHPTPPMPKKKKKKRKKKKKKKRSSKTSPSDSNLVPSKRPRSDESVETVPGQPPKKKRKKKRKKKKKRMKHQIKK